MIAPSDCQHENRKKNGKIKDGTQRYRCKDCGKQFTEETLALGGMRIGIAQAERIVKALCEGVSARATARLMDCDVHTVIELMNLVGERCQRYMESEIQGVIVGDVQIDEIWQFVGAKQKTAQLKNLGPGVGDSWCFTAIERNTKLLICWHLGARDQYNTELFADKLRTATSGRFHLSSDGFTQYQYVIPNALAGRIDYGQIVKIYGTPSKEEQRKYSPAKISKIKKRAVWGSPSDCQISTSHCERMNLNLRTFNRRYTRLTNGFSKKWENHEMSMALQIFHYNYVRRHGTLKTTPAVASGLEKHEWSVRELILKTSII